MSSKRKILADALSKAHTCKGWIWAEDNTVPSNAYGYIVYDELEVKGGGFTLSRVPEFVSGCKMPIVFYQPEIRTTTDARSGQNFDSPRTETGNVQ